MESSTTIDVDDACNGDASNGDGCWKRIEDELLTEVDKKKLLNGKWVSDKVIHASQLLMKQDRDVSSLQNPDSKWDCGHCEWDCLLL